MSSCCNVKFVTRKSDKTAYFFKWFIFQSFFFSKKKINKNIFKVWGGGGNLCFNTQIYYNNL